MNDQEKQYFEELILKAVQSGKKETSGLVAEIMHKMEQGIEASINKNVNGKIKRLDEKIDAYIISDDKWKQDVSPYIQGLVNVSGTGKILGKFAIWVTAIGGAILLIKEHIK